MYFFLAEVLPLVLLLRFSTTPGGRRLGKTAAPPGTSVG